MRTIRSSSRSRERGGSRQRQGMRAPFRTRGGGRSLSTKAGLRRYTWDLRRDGISGRGPMVAPGEYELCLVHSGGQHRQRLTVTLDPNVAAAGITDEDLAAQAELILAVQQLRKRANNLRDSLRRRLGGDLNDAERARLEQVQSRLVDARITYPQRMLMSQISYLGSMIDRADQRPGKDAYRRLEQLRKAIDECEQKARS